MFLFRCMAIEYRWLDPMLCVCPFYPWCCHSGTTLSSNYGAAKRELNVKVLVFPGWCWTTVPPHESKLRNNKHSRYRLNRDQAGSHGRQTMSLVVLLHMFSTVGPRHNEHRYNEIPAITNWFWRSQRTIYPAITNILSYRSKSAKTAWWYK